ncbi:neuropeptide CCHamide-1 receptor isoform X2 [Folsomia candida]|uniref:neuropeptide CCHamide-1 receptor isoform X2 n=1 Tax=Folsomia candida TaxID=158441 RepID=UPI000B8FE38C|nr:neuropeptide CCHamide-1 receptor isoform X2 [Folsomia candida]
MDDAVLMEDILTTNVTTSLSPTPPSFGDESSFSTKFANDTLDYVPYSARPETYIVPILFAIIFVIGVMGNGTLIGIFVKHRTMRNVPNMYIVSLAVGDLFVILFCVPFTSTVYTVESWPYGEFVCKFSEFIKDLSIGVSVFTLTALSADRYFAIVDPMRKLHGRRATKITCITIAGIWVLSVVMALPSAVFSYVMAIDQDPRRIFYVCYPFPPELGKKYPQVMVMSHFLVYYAIPLLFIGTFYIIMARHLILSTRNMPGEAQGQAKQIQARKKVAKMILSFVVIFAICFFPSHLFLLWFYFYPESEYHFNEFWNACRITGFCLSFINSCINPITLYCVSGTFRKQFNEHLFCCVCEADGRSRPARRRAAGFGCGCVSLSSAGPMLLGAGGDYRLRNGYVSGRGLCRGSTTNSMINGTIKRKSTWDTQSTTYGYNMNNMTNNAPHGRDTPTTTNTSPDATLPHNHSTTLNITTNPTSSSANVSFPLTHHPYQKDYQEYLNRINALEKGDSPPRVRKVDNSARRNVGNVTKTKLAKTNWKSEEEIIQEQNNETEVTSFINLKKTTTKMSEGGYYHGSDSGCSEDCNVDEANVDSPLMNRAKVEGKGEKIALG